MRAVEAIGESQVVVGYAPYLESIATWNKPAGELTIFAVNRDQQEELVLEGSLRGFGKLVVVEHLVLTHADPKAVNTKDNPSAVLPCRVDGTRLDGGALLARLPRLSWNVIRLKAT